MASLMRATGWLDVTPGSPKTARWTSDRVASSVGYACTTFTTPWSPNCAAAVRSRKANVRIGLAWMPATTSCVSVSENPPASVRIGWRSVMVSPTPAPRSSAALRASRIRGSAPPVVAVPSLDGRCPHRVVEIDELDQEVEVVVGFGCERGGGQPQSGIDVSDRGSVGDGGDDRGVVGVERVELDDDAVGVALGELVVSSLEGPTEAVEHSEHRHQSGDRSADTDRGQHRAPRGPQHVADRHLRHGRTGQSQSSGPAGQPGGPGRQVTGTDRLDRLDAERPPDREGAGCDRDRDSEQGGLEVHGRTGTVCGGRGVAGTTRAGSRTRCPPGVRRRGRRSCRARRPGRRSAVGGSRVVVRGTPSAIPIPISRRWASTIRLIRLNAASAAASRTSADRAFQNRWSLSMSS